MARSALWLCHFFVCLSSIHKVEEKVKLNGKVGFDGISAVTSVHKRRLIPLALIPQIMPDSISNLAIINIFNEEIDMPIVDSASDVLDA